MSATLTNSYKKAIAAIIKAAATDVFFAWGSGDTNWGDAKFLTSVTFGGDDVLPLSFPNVSSVIVRSHGGGTTYVVGVDYSINASTGVLTRLAGAIGQSTALDVDFVAGYPDVDEDTTALVNEIGRRKAGNKQFVVQDDAGSISVNGTRYTASEDPTGLLYIETVFDEGDAPTEHIKEGGLFCNVSVDPDTEDGQLYFTPEEIVDQGLMMLYETFSAITRNAARKEVFHIILSF